MEHWGTEGSREEIDETMTSLFGSKVCPSSVSNIKNNRTAVQSHLKQ